MTLIKLSNIFVFPHLNKKFGIDIVHSYFDNNIFSYINLEIIGEEVYGSFQIRLDIFDKQENLVAHIQHIPIHGETFDGITAKKIHLTNYHLKALENNHIRIYPTNSYLENKHFNSMTLIQVGINFGERKKYINDLKVGDNVILTLDKYNEFDKFAVKVSTIQGNHIGFLSSECAFIYNQFVQDSEEKQAIVLKINKSSIYLRSPVSFDSKNKFLFGG